VKVSSRSSAVSSLFITWQAPESRRFYPIARLTRVSDGEFELAYIRAVREAEREGFAGLPGFEDVEEVYRSSALPSLFQSRTASRGRRVHLEGESESVPQPANDVLDAAPITLFLNRQPGAPAERLEAFAPPLPGGGGRYWGAFVIRGVGRVGGSADLVERLSADEALALVPEPDNAYNPRALLVARTDGTLIGYAPDYLANELSLVPLVTTSVHLGLLAVHRITFSPAQPLYQVTCRYECAEAVGRALFRSPAYEPLSPRAFNE
jgi:hypothetical protein